MPGVQSLPLELVLEIMLYVFVETRGQPQHEFQNFSLVCKTWRPYAQRLLFRDIRLHSPEAVYGFLKATCPVEEDTSEEHLGHCVRTLDTTLMSKDMISLLPFVLRHCPKLYEFSATIYNPVDIKNIKNPPAPSQTMTTAATNAGFSSIASIPYKEMPIPSVQAMRINSRTNQSPLIGPFLSLWPNLSHLILLGHSLTSVLAQTAIPRMKLYELQCIRSTPGLVVPSVFQGLLKASVGSLKILDISGLDYGTIKGMKDFFVEHGPHLRSLRLPVIPPDIPLPFLQHCTELEELIVYSYPCPTIRQHIPVEKLVHVLFVILTSQASQTLKPMIAWLRKMPQLKVLTWTTRPGGDCNLTNDTKTLQKLCTAMNVYLRSTEPISINIKSEELIQPSSFPRDELITPVWR